MPWPAWRRHLPSGEPEALLDPAALETLGGGGFLILDEHALAATAAGRRRLDGVLATLLADPRTATGAVGA